MQKPKYGSVDHFGRLTSRIYIGNAGPKGVGVFAKSDIPKGYTIESSPVLIIDMINKENWTYFDRYIYHVEDNTYALALGYASLYNHSVSPNAEYGVSHEADPPRINITALKNIKKGSEILINYNGDPKDKTLWDFDDS